MSKLQFFYIYINRSSPVFLRHSVHGTQRKLLTSIRLLVAAAAEADRAGNTLGNWVLCTAEDAADTTGNNNDLKCTNIHLYFANWQQANNKINKMIKQLNHSVNANERTGVGHKERNMDCSHTTFLS